MRRAQIIFLAKLAISLLLLWLVLRRLDPAGILARLRATDGRWLLPALVLAPASVVLSAWRWTILSQGLLGLGEAVRYTWIGLFFGTILPGLVGGDVAKGLSLAAKDPRARDARLPVSIVVDKLVGFWVLLLLFNLVALGLLLTQPLLLAGLRGAVLGAGAVTLAGLLGGAALCHPRGASFLPLLVSRLPFAPLRAVGHKISSALASYAGQGSALLRAAGLSVLLHALNALGFWLAMHSLAIPASLLFAAVFYPLLSGLLALPVSISGVGVRDVFAAAVFTAFGLNPEAGVAFSWLLLGLGLPSALLGGLIQLWEFFTRKTPAHAPG